MRIRYSSNVTLQADTYYPLLIYFGERTGVIELILDGQDQVRVGQLT